MNQLFSVQHPFSPGFSQFFTSYTTSVRPKQTPKLWPIEKFVHARPLPHILRHYLSLHRVPPLNNNNSLSNRHPFTSSSFASPKRTLVTPPWDNFCYLIFYRRADPRLTSLQRPTIQPFAAKASKHSTSRFIGYGGDNIMIRAE